MTQAGVGGSAPPGDPAHGPPSLFRGTGGSALALRHPRRSGPCPRTACRHPPPAEPRHGRHAAIPASATGCRQLRPPVPTLWLAQPLPTAGVERPRKQLCRTPPGHPAAPDLTGPMAAELMELLRTWGCGSLRQPGNLCSVSGEASGTSVPFLSVVARGPSPRDKRSLGRHSPGAQSAWGGSGGLGVRLGGGSKHRGVSWQHESGGQG